MDTEHPEAAMENREGKEDHTKTQAFVEAAALLTLWSVIVINEGAVRVNETIPSIDLLGGGRPPKFLAFMGGLVEVIFGLVGLFVGLYGLLARWYSKPLTILAMVIQTVLGYYTFIVYVFVLPIYQAGDLTDPIVEGLSLGQSKAVIIMGLLTSFHFCLALQGGQFVFMARMVVAGSGNDFLRQKSGARMRAIFWNANMALSGLWTMIAGSIIVANAAEDGELSMQYVAPPNVGTLPGLTVYTGVLLLIWGVVGVAMAVLKRPVRWIYFSYTGIVYIFALLNYGIVQFGQFESPSGPLSIHNGLVFMTVWLGPYFLSVCQREEEDEEKES